MAPRPAKARLPKEKAGKQSTKGRGRAATGANAPTQEDKASMAKVLSHPTRVKILAASHREEISPSGFARARGLATSSVAEHFRKLADYGAIKLIRKEPIKGSVRHVYVGTKRGIISAKDWQTLPESVQSDIAAAGFQDFVDVTAQAIESGSFTARPNFVFTWDEPELDEIGWDTFSKMLRLLWTKVPRLEEESALRLAKTGESSMKAIVGLAAFEAPKPTKPQRKASKKRSP